MEEMRPLIVDALVIAMFRRRVLAADAFHRVGGDGGVYLTDRARRTFLTEYEKRMLTLFTYQPTGERITYRRALARQALMLVHVLTEPDTQYAGVLMS
jgi:CRISPR-associated protein Cas1